MCYCFSYVLGYLAVCYTLCLRRGFPLPHLCSLGVFFHWKTPLTASPHKRSFICSLLSYLPSLCLSALFHLIYLALLCLVAVLYRLCFLAVLFVLRCLVVCYTGRADRGLHSSPAVCTLLLTGRIGITHESLCSPWLLLRYFIFLYHILISISYNSFHFSLLFILYRFLLRIGHIRLLVFVAVSPPLYRSIVARLPVLALVSSFHKMVALYSFLF